jgi:mRNA-degrading endonuclease toxin of MazEF toxin-antitoxin module
MKKKWIIGLALVPVAFFGAVAAVPAVLPIWEQYRPRPVVVVNSAMRQQAIATLVTQVSAHYVFPEKATQIETLLRQRQRNGDYDGITNGEQLAATLTRDMASVAADLHMRVEFSPEVLPPQLPRRSGLPAAGPIGWIDRIGMKLAKFGIEKAERLPSNIGYLELSAFPFPQMTAEKYAAAMDKLADTDAMIIDLRGNGGGSPASVALLASYFVDQRTQLNGIWYRDTGVTEYLWTEDKLAGKRYGAQRKVAILVGPGTRSAGEDFAYTMQKLKRATLIGARTWGGAHPTSSYRLGDHFVGRIPNARTISPITKSNWEGVGVIPDIEAAPAEALSVAKAHLLNQQPRAASMRVALPQL